MVVNHVEQHGEPPRVGRVHKPLQPIRSTIGLMHRIQCDAVITPPIVTRESIQRHQLDVRYAQFDQRIQLPDRRIERALACEGPDVQLVEDRTRQRIRLKPCIRPAKCGLIVGPR